LLKWVCFLGFFTSLSLFGQVTIREGFTHQRIVKDVAYCIDSQHVWKREGLKPFLKRDFRLLSKHYIKHQNTFPIVLRLEVKNVLNKDVSCILDFNNSEINGLQVAQFDASGKQVYASPLLGDVFPFSKRLIPYRVLAVPFLIRANCTQTLFIGLENKNRMITGYLDVDLEDYWHLKTRNTSFSNGWLVGLYLGFILIGIIIYFVLRQTLFLYYTLYVTGVTVLILTIWGYPFQSVFPNNLWLQDRFLLVVQLFGLLFLNLYALSLFQLEGPLPFLQKTKKGVLALFAFMILLVIIGIGKWLDAEEVLSNVLFSIEALNFACLVFSGPVMYWYKKRNSALVFFLSFIPVGLALLYSSLSFLIPSMPYVLLMDSLSVTLFLEVLVLSIYMIYQFKKSLLAKIVLERALFASAKENQLAFMRGQEDEKKKIALELHDGIATDLLVLKKGLQHAGNSTWDTIDKDLERVVFQIRTISHQLLPWSFHHKSMKEALQDLFAPLIFDYEVNMYIDELPDWLGAFQQNQLFRIIQELLKNTLKHAEAKHISFQLMNYDNLIEMHLEDDGKGFSIHSETKGIGWKSVLSRAESIGGELKIESHPNLGTVVLFSLKRTVDSKA